MKTAAELLANWNKEHERGAKWSEWLDDVRWAVFDALRRAQAIEEAAEKVLRRFGDEYEGRFAELRAALGDEETT